MGKYVIRISFAYALLLALDSATASAYIGPGLSVGAIGALLGIMGSVFLAFLAIIYYPIKRLLRKLKAKTKKSLPEKKDLQIS